MFMAEKLSEGALVLIPTLWDPNLDCKWIAVAFFLKEISW